MRNDWNDLSQINLEQVDEIQDFFDKLRRGN